MGTGFSAGQAARISGVPYRTLDYWARSGFLRPGLANASGKGSDRRYDFRDLVALRVAGELRRAGVSLQALRRVVERVRDLCGGEQPLVDQRLVIVGNDVVVARGAQLISVLHEYGQLYFATIVVDLRMAEEQVRERLAA